MTSRGCSKRAVVGLGWGLFAAVAPLSAQGVSEIQIAPVTLTLRVGEERTFLATAYDGRGNPLLGTTLTWISTDLQVVRVTFDPASPNVATITAVGPGVAQIEARSGSVRSQAVIQVTAAPAPVPLPDSVLPGEVSTASVAQVTRIEPQIYGTTAPCELGAFLDPSLLVTTYTAIRGAGNLTVTLANGQRVTDVRVAAHDVARNIAVLSVPGTRTGSLASGSDPTRNAWVWALDKPGCQQTVATPMRVSRVTGEVVETSGDAQIGAPVVDRAGSLIAVATGGTTSIPVSRLRSLIDQARQNLGRGSLTSAADVARQENHSYGSLALRSEVLGASARVTPLENWQWPELRTENQLPFTFTGPIGRYRIELISNGAVQSSITAEPRAGDVTQIMLTPLVVAAEPEPTNPPAEPQLQASHGGGFPIAIVVVGLAAAGGGAFLLTRSGGSEPNPNPGNGPPNKGGIRIRIPIP